MIARFRVMLAGPRFSCAAAIAVLDLESLPPWHGSEFLLVKPPGQVVLILTRILLARKRDVLAPSHSDCKQLANAPVRSQSFSFPLQQTCR